MDAKEIIMQTLKGIEMTSVEKIKKLGLEAAYDDLDRLKDMYDEMVFFWGFDEGLIDKFDERMCRIIEIAKSDKEE